MSGCVQGCELQGEALAQVSSVNPKQMWKHGVSIA